MPRGIRRRIRVRRLIAAMVWGRSFVDAFSTSKSDTSPSRLRTTALGQDGFLVSSSSAVSFEETGRERTRRRARRPATTADLQRHVSSAISAANNDDNNNNNNSNTSSRARRAGGSHRLRRVPVANGQGSDSTRFVLVPVNSLHQSTFEFSPGHSAIRYLLYSLDDVRTASTLAAASTF